MLFHTKIARRVVRLQEDARSVAQGRPILSEIEGDDEIAQLGHTLKETSQLLARQAPTRSHPRKRPAKLRQTQLPLEIVSKGRFDKSEPTIHKGEDLDVPTYVRRGVALN